MPAPKNNSYWKNRTTHGPKRTFDTPQAFEQAWLDYFQWVDKHPWYKTEQLKKPIIQKKGKKETVITTIQIPTKRPYTEVGFIAFHGLGKNYLNQLEDQLKKKPDEDMSGILSWARGVCYADKFEGAAVGAYNQSIIARDLGLREGHEIMGKDGKPIQTESKVQSNVDYSQLPDEVLEMIVKARKPSEE